MEYCDKHMESIKDIATMSQAMKDMQHSFEEIKERMVLHIIEGERQGGVRDRLMANEKDVENLRIEIGTIKRGYWKACIVSGLIGGLLADAAPEAFKLIIGFLK